MLDLSDITSNPFNVLTLVAVITYKKFHKKLYTCF
jgi:hypothetical protein